MEKHKGNEKQLSLLDENDRKKEVSAIFIKITNGIDTQESIDKELEKLGIYKLEVPVSEDEVTPSSTSSDVDLAIPFIYYDTQINQWCVAASGNWSTDKWFYEDTVGDCGGPDGVGIAYYNTSGTYTAKVKSSYAYMTDQKGENTIETDNPTNGDGKLGVEFELQDKCPYNPTDVRYIGARFGCQIWYSSDWSTFNGKARTVYAHTWSSTTINSVKFGVSGKTAGFDITFSSSNNRFSCVNGTDASF